MPFEAQLIAWGLGLLTLFIASVFALLKWFFARYVSGIDTRLAAAEIAISKEADKRRDLEKEFRNFLAALPEKYVAREDWIIMVARVENKMDGLAKMVMDIASLSRGHK